MQLTGTHFINRTWQASSNSTFEALHAKSAEPLPPAVHQANAEELQMACDAATQAAAWYQQQPLSFRAQLLERIADELIACPSLLPRLEQETALPKARLDAELARTCAQLRSFASVLRQRPAYHAAQATASHAALLKLELPLGPVAVFAASNFPLAFSVAGGDTASALAAGCPVIVKAHPAHPGGSEWAMRAIERALNSLQVPVALVQLLQQNQASFSHQLVMQPQIAAVSFTGSAAAGTALYETACSRAEPIPFYGELGAINPQLVLPTIEMTTVDTLATMWLQAVTGSGGQLCTKPGVWWLPNNAAGIALVAQMQQLLRQQPAQYLLSPLFLQRYNQLSDARSACCPLWAEGQVAENQASSRMWVCHTLDMPSDVWQQEIFGPCCQVLLYDDLQQVTAAWATMPGQLAMSLHGPWQQFPELIAKAARHCGRLVLGQLPTGVAVHPLMMHGGPWPASTNSQFSAVGLQAMQRFVRPLCIQGADVETLQAMVGHVTRSSESPG